MSILVWQVNSIGITMYLGVLVYEKKKEKKRDKKLVEPQDNSITVSGLLMTPKSDFVRTPYTFFGQTVHSMGLKKIVFG